MKLSNKIEHEIKALSNNRCFYCGESFYNVKFEIDHFEPLSLNRNGKRENLVASCKRCNRLKANLSIEEFRCKISELFGCAIIFFFEKYGINRTSTERYFNTLNEKSF